MLSTGWRLLKIFLDTVPGSRNKKKITNFNQNWSNRRQIFHWGLNKRSSTQVDTCYICLKGHRFICKPLYDISNIAWSGFYEKDNEHFLNNHYALERYFSIQYCKKIIGSLNVWVLLDLSASAHCVGAATEFCWRTSTTW